MSTFRSELLAGRNYGLYICLLEHVVGGGGCCIVFLLFFFFFFKYFVFGWLFGATVVNPLTRPFPPTPSPAQ